MFPLGVEPALPQTHRILISSAEKFESRTTTLHLGDFRRRAQRFRSFELYINETTKNLTL